MDFSSVAASGSCDATWKHNWMGNFIRCRIVKVANQAINELAKPMTNPASFFDW